VIPLSHSSNGALVWKRHRIESMETGLK
jgi:hypothetical protein